MPQSAIHRHDILPPAPDGQKASIAPTKKPGRAATIWRLVRHAVPTVIVVSVLIGLGIWGHSTDWTFPKFSSLVGDGAEKSERWCEEHNVPEAQCIECDKRLVPPLSDYGWCNEHGISQCPLHHPDVAQLSAIPKITAEDMVRANKALALLPRAENNSHCKVYQRRIQFASTNVLEQLGIDVAVVEQHPIVETVSANGEIVYDETHTAHLASRAAGNVWRVQKQVGDEVRKGDILALIDSAEIGRAKSELLHAITQLRLTQVNVDKLQPLAKDGAVAGKQLRDAEAELQEAQTRFLSAQQALVNLGLSVKADEFDGLSTEQVAKQIQFLGLPNSLVGSLDENATTSNLFPLRSPLDGVVMECKVVAGEIVDTSTTIFGITDLQKMWLILDTRQDDAQHLSLGQSVLFRPTSSKNGPDIKGTISWISTAADDKTRTLKVRADIANLAGSLRANTFGTGRVIIRDEPKAVVVPSEAVHSDGDCQLIFVRDKNYLNAGAPKFFHVRQVRLGAKNGDLTEIIAGVLPGELIASKNSAILEAQLLKGNLGEDDD